MPPRKTIKLALVDALEDLTQQDFTKFCHHLLDRREEPRVRRSRVEGKGVLGIVDVLVSTFTEPGALEVALVILRQIGCNEEARTLVVVRCSGSDHEGLIHTALQLISEAGNCDELILCSRDIETAGKH